MVDFVIQLGSHKVGVSCQFPCTRTYCTGYLTEGPENMHVEIQPEDLYAERLRAIEEARAEGREYKTIPPYGLEHLAVYRKIADRMLEHDTLLFHGSVISVDGQGYLFTALSGTGKSTHTRLWRELFGDRAVMVNDDKPLLRITQDRVYVCGSPWNGKHCLGTNMEVPLKGLCILTRAEENSIVPVEPLEAMPVLLQQCHRPKDPAAMSKVLELLNKLSTRTGLYRLGCNMDPEAAVVAYNGMNRKENA